MTIKEKEVLISFFGLEAYKETENDPDKMSLMMKALKMAIYIAKKDYGRGSFVSVIDESKLDNIDNITKHVNLYKERHKGVLNVDYKFWYAYTIPETEGVFIVYTQKWTVNNHEMINIIKVDSNGDPLKYIPERKIFLDLKLFSIRDVLLYLRRNTFND